MARSSPNTLTPLDILGDYLDKKTTFKNDYPNSDKNVSIPLLQLINLPNNQVINRRMKEIVPSNVLRQFLESKTTTYDDFLILRRNLSYQYGAFSCLHYLLSIPLLLENIFINLKTGDISLWNLPIKADPSLEQPFALRLSAGIQELFGESYVNGGCLPAFIATSDALCNKKFNYKAYLQLLLSDLNKIRPVKTSELFSRI